MKVVIHQKHSHTPLTSNYFNIQYTKDSYSHSCRMYLKRVQNFNFASQFFGSTSSLFWELVPTTNQNYKKSINCGPKTGRNFVFICLHISVLNEKLVATSTLFCAYTSTMGQEIMWNLKCYIWPIQCQKIYKTMTHVHCWDARICAAQ